jgi:hypothetical protein
MPRRNLTSLIVRNEQERLRKLIEDGLVASFLAPLRYALELLKQAKWKREILFRRNYQNIASAFRDRHLKIAMSNLQMPPCRLGDLLLRIRSLSSHQPGLY